MQMTRRFVLLAVPALALIAGVSAWAGHFALAVAGLSASILAAFAWIVLWTRLVNVRLAGLRNLHEGVSAQSGQVASLAQQVEWIRAQLANDGRVSVNLRKLNESIAAEASQASAQLRSGFALVRRDLERLDVAAQRLPATTVELGRRYAQLVRHDRSMPSPGGWALTSATLVWILDQIASGAVSRILECGSGTSTVWFAAAFEERGEGHVFALESDPDFAAQTRSQLADLGLSHRADVIDAPLVYLAVNGRERRPWYDLGALPDSADDINLLFVDGPLGGLAPESRYPAYPLLADRLADDAIVVLDDTIRPDEARIVETWVGEEHAGRRLERMSATDRSTAMRVMPGR